MAIKMVHHVCIQTEKYKESLDFYNKILGFEIINVSENFHNRKYNTWLKLGDFMIELQTPKVGDKFNKWSNLNSGPVHMGFLVENVEYEYERIKNLNDINVNIIKSEKCKETYEAISYHPDINLIKLNDENILVSPNLYDYYNEVLSPLGFNISSGDSIIKNKYPYNVAYNAIIIGNKAIHNFNYTDKKLLQFIEENNFTKIHVKQGYCKCSTCIVDENSLITSDEGIYKEVIKHNIDCLLIESGHINLFELNYGFIGGCSGLISEDTLAFFGDISKHPNYLEIKNFVRSKNKKILSLSKEKLLDLGSLIPLY